MKDDKQSTLWLITLLYLTNIFERDGGIFVTRGVLPEPPAQSQLSRRFLTTSIFCNSVMYLNLN